MSSRPALRIEPLTTARLDLTPLDPARDAAALHVMLSDPETHRYDTDARASASVEETEGRLRLQVVANGGSTWAIRLRGGAPIGTIGVFADQGTTIRGVGWSLAASHWRHGITGEAARAAVPYLLAQDGVEGLEAWIDSRNVASLGVARAAGMSLGGRLPRDGGGVAQTLVMVRAARRDDPEVLSSFTTLGVRDLRAAIESLRSVLRLHVAWALPDPPRIAFLAFEPWSGSPGLQLTRVDGAIVPQELSVEVAVAVDEVRARVVRAGLTVVDEPAEQPWFRREMSFRTADGHLIRVSGPSTPRQPGD